jgi:hypothetical protein
MEVHSFGKGSFKKRRVSAAIVATFQKSSLKQRGYGGSSQKALVYLKK